jgi:hypothetical protein
MNKAIIIFFLFFTCFNAAWTEVVVSDLGTTIVSPAGQIVDTLSPPPPNSYPSSVRWIWDSNGAQPG